MDLLIPTARIVDLVIIEEQVPMSMAGEISGLINGHAQASEIAARFGRTHKPRQPLMVYGPDNYMPIMIIGDGVTEAAEMQDLAEEAIGRQEEAAKRNGGRGMNFDDARERRGLVRRENFGAAVADAIARHDKMVRANHRTRKADADSRKNR